MVAFHTTKQQPAPHKACVLALLDARGFDAEDYVCHLSTGERERYLSITSRPRKLKWLTGRLAAKYLFLSRLELAQRQARTGQPLLLSLSGQALDAYSSWMYRKIEVLPQENETPRFIWCDEERKESISLSHTDGTSCACLGFAGPISVDIENTVPRVAEFYRKTFTVAEQSWVKRTSGKHKSHSEWLFTLLWTLKESALKLYTANQTVWDLPRIEIVDLPDCDQFAPLRNDRSLATDFLTFPTTVRDPHCSRQVNVAVTGSRNLVLTVMNEGVIN